MFQKIEIASIIPFNIVSNIMLQKIFWDSYISLRLQSAFPLNRIAAIDTESYSCFCIRRNRWIVVFWSTEKARFPQRQASVDSPSVIGSNQYRDR